MFFQRKMPRFWIKKTNRTISPADIMKIVVAEFRQEAKLLTTAGKYDVDKLTLNRYVKHATSATSGSNIHYSLNFKSAFVFISEEEALLSDYLIRTAQMHHDFRVVCARQLTFQFAQEILKK